MKIYSILRKGKLNESGMPVRSGEDFIESVIAKKLFGSGGESYIAPDGNTYKYRYDVVDNSRAGYNLYVYSNYAFAFCKQDTDIGWYRLVTVVKDNNGTKYCGYISAKKNTIHGTFNASAPGTKSFDIIVAKTDGTTIPYNWIVCEDPTKITLPVYDTYEDALAHIK